jgi:hypothetical protein
MIIHPDPKNLLKNWRQLPTSELQTRIEAIRLAAADTSKPYHFETNEWAVLDKMRAELAARQKTEKAANGDGAASAEAAPAIDTMSVAANLTLTDQLEPIAQRIEALQSTAILKIASEAAKIHETFRYRRNEGGYAGYMRTRLGYSRSSAYRLLDVHERFGGNVSQVWDRLPVSAIYLLAAPSTPEKALDEVTKRVGANERLTYAVVTEIIAGAKDHSIDGNGAGSAEDSGNSEADDDVDDGRSAKNGAGDDQDQHDGDYEGVRWHDGVCADDHRRTPLGKFKRWIEHIHRTHEGYDVMVTVPRTLDTQYRDTAARVILESVDKLQKLAAKVRGDESPTSALGHKEDIDTTQVRGAVAALLKTCAKDRHFTVIMFEELRRMLKNLEDEILAKF